MPVIMLYQQKAGPTFKKCSKISQIEFTSQGKINSLQLRTKDGIQGSN